MPDPAARIRRAVPADTERIYQLKRAAFGESYLPFTVFQSPKSISYLRDLIASGGPHAWFVLPDGSEVCGYYDGHPVGETAWFLAYVAVGKAWRGRGYGDALLAHFEKEGLARGLGEGALDVFASNPAAIEWYARQGYATAGRREYLRARLDRFERAARCGLELPADALRQALEDEQRRGFSKVEASCDSARLVVGFIGGDTVKLLSCDGMTLADAASSLAVRFRESRESLILTGTEDELRPLPEGRREIALRLVKRWRP